MRTWQVGDVMSTDVVTVGLDTPYRRIVDVLNDRRISAVPVVDESHRVLGVVSEADLLHKVELIGQPHERRVFASRQRRRAWVKADAAVAADLMSAPAVTAHPDMSLVEAAKILNREQIKRLPVIDDLGRLVGIVTRSDLLKVYLRPDDDIRSDIVREVLGRVLGVEDGLVQVTVQDGVVRLTGRLDRRSSTDIAGRLAVRVSGVVEVINDLGFDYDDTRSDLRDGPSPFANVA